MRMFLMIFCVGLILGGCEKKSDESAVLEAGGGSITVTPDAINATSENPLISYDMDGQRRLSLPQNSDENSDILRQISAISGVRNNYANVAKELLGKRLSKNYFLKCSSCHDDYANGVIGPSLLTKNSDQIFDMIKSYKQRSEKNVLMEYLVSQMDDKEIRSLSDEISKFNEEVRRQKDESK